jgi:hypothetical protein
LAAVAAVHLLAQEVLRQVVAILFLVQLPQLAAEVAVRHRLPPEHQAALEVEADMLTLAVLVHLDKVMQAALVVVGLLMGVVAAAALAQ